MEAKSSFTMVLLIIIAVLAIAVCGLTGYIFIYGGSSKTVEKVVQAVKVPAESELVSLKLFEKKLMNLKGTDTNKSPVIQVNVEIKYMKKVPGIKVIEEKIKSNESAMKEIVGTYFQKMTLEEAKKPDTKETVKKELTKQLNDFLNANEKEKELIIYTIYFDDWFYQ